MALIFSFISVTTPRWSLPSFTEYPFWVIFTANVWPRTTKPSKEVPGKLSHIHPLGGTLPLPSLILVAMPPPLATFTTTLRVTVNGSWLLAPGDPIPGPQETRAEEPS